MKVQDTNSTLTELSQTPYSLGIKDFGVMRMGIKDFGVMRMGIKDFGVMTPTPRKAA